MKKKLIFLIGILFLQVMMFGETSQTITVDVNTKGTENRIYTLGSGSSERAIIDLGHFNSMQGKVSNIKLATVTVTIDMGNEKICKVDEGMDVSDIDTEKLKDFTFGSYDVTKFLGQKNGAMTLKINDLRILTPVPTDKGKIYIGCNSNEVKYFKYQFDLIVDLTSLEQESMYGFSPQKEETQGFLNVKDIVLEQIRYSNIKN